MAIFKRANEGFFRSLNIDILNETYVVSLMHPQFLNVVECFSALLTKALVLVSVDFVLKNATLLKHLLNPLIFLNLNAQL